VKLNLISNASVLTPRPLGLVDVLFVDKVIFKIDKKIDQKALAQAKLDVEVIDAKGNYLIPGIIDPHSHLLGGSGENGGFSSQTPEITLTELTRAGITTVVGTLGADTVMKTMPGLLACAKGLIEEGLSAYVYTGGYPIPPETILKDPREDIMYFEEVIGLGEVAIADERSHEPQIPILAKMVISAHLGGMLSNKAGVTHFHVGPGYWRMKCIQDLMEYSKQIRPEWIYPTHIERSKELIKDAIRLSKQGSFVDMDVAEGDLDKWLQVYVDSGGPLEKLTISSDASKSSPSNILNEITHCVHSKKFKLEELLPLVTRNPCEVLKLKSKGEIKVGFEASFVILDKKTLTVQDVASKGHFMIRNGNIVQKEKFLEESNRVIHLDGEDSGEEAKI
jgi:beta-aspartyl-dipeptidase (metallo-type)